MAEGVISQVAGEAVKGICRNILQAAKRIIKFESIVKDLRATIESLAPRINRIAQLKEKHQYLEDEICKLMLQLNQAEELINRCARDVAWWNYCKKYRYSKKLLELDASLSKSLMDLPLLIWEDTAQILDEIIKLNEKLDRIVHEKECLW
ncbi:hypothetical protein Patl1_28769 [Pistacia atlantica]|uniref:Uncharacterized protein n=1 Tax=Pistacia atlantica TaxID=434234 RepID=A0ACC1BFG1_9ROSI|nr:hypothetical protein Patl1_28769 [Pistacia atlantica]